MKLFLPLFFLFTFSLHAYELVFIKSMDVQKRTFIIRQGKKDGIVIGKKSTFTANNVSFIAKAIQTSREFSQWEIENPKIEIPFSKSDIITFYDTTEHLWTLTPEKARMKYLKKQLAPPLKHFLTLYGGFSRGLSASFDDVPNQEIQRGGYELEIYYDKEFSYNFVLSGGLRYSRESQNFTGSSFIVSRLLLIGEASYFFKPIKKLGMTRFHISTALGWGQSATQSDLITQTGYATLLPLLKVGFEVPYERYRFMSNIAVETISSKEERSRGVIQSYQNTNFKMMFGMKFFL